MKRFDPQPDAAHPERRAAESKGQAAASPAPDLPRAFPSPFDEQGPHPLARRAADELRARLAARPAPLEGKMFGVLVVQAPDGDIGYLSAFSGMLQGEWRVEGFAPPLFDPAARAALEPQGDATVKDLLLRHAALGSSEALTGLRDAAATLAARHADERSAQRARHDTNRQQRREARAMAHDEAALHALDQHSRADKAERRRLDAHHAADLERVAAPLRRLERRLRALERLRQYVCRVLMAKLQDTYRVANARGEVRSLRALYAKGAPPSGAADCAAPKLLAEAWARGLRPLALAEFWWGPTPLAGGRVHGAFYPACRGKCGPLLPFMLEGIEVAPPRPFAPKPAPPAALDVVYEDAWLVIIDKPSGLLSVPGKGAAHADSVLRRLRTRYPFATGPLLVHRLDLDTSGLLVAALDARTHRALQRQFLRREIHKRYVAWVEGRIGAERGTIELALRVDLDDRPRQLHDPVHGRPAITDWEVLQRDVHRTCVALYPRTGRTHQLRVHAAHPLGLGAAITGDRLYGAASERLLLHAERLAFIHPGTGAPVSFERAAPFPTLSNR